MQIQEAILRNIFVGQVGDHGVKIRYDGGNILFDWSCGKTTRMHKASNWVDSVVPLPDGRELIIKPGQLFS